MREGTGSRMKTKYLSVRYRHLVSGRFPNAGPRPCVYGMKKHYYGLDSICVMCGQFLYYLGKEFTDETWRIYSLAK